MTTPIGENLLYLAGQIFMPVVIEATAFVVCFNVSLKIIELVRGLTNPKKGGGEIT